VIGDCRSAALISRSGSIDWLCWPRFDSPSIFGAILDSEKGGRWSITPTEPCASTRRYIEDSNVLETRFRTSSGELVITDLMPVASEEFKQCTLWPDHEIVRDVFCTQGEVRIEIDFHPRAAYGSSAVRIDDAGTLGLRMNVGRGAYRLRGTIPLTIQNGRARATLTLSGGQRVRFSLTYSEESPAVLPLLGEECTDRIDMSVRWWQQWAARCTYSGRYRDAVIRSALALKLLAYAPSGAIIAAPTTSLPELIGGSLNWDYRYCWLRDASLTVRALLGLGYSVEAESFLTWLLHATQLTQPELRVLYSIFGQIAPHERDLDYLSGYSESRPVRIGNGARNQLQMDIYGEVIDAAAQYVRHGGRFDRTTQDVLIGFGKYVAANWDVPDEGIWEPRGGRMNHTHSRLMCWTALDRLLELHHRKLLRGGPFKVFSEQRGRIAKQIRERAWNEKLQSYTGTLDGEDMDATLLRLPWYGFEKPNSARMRATYDRVCEQLGAGRGLLYRYSRSPAEGAFGICGFWAAEYLAIGGGSLEDANECFWELLHHRNDLGLFSEETDPSTEDALGNFPQAFTHVGLISAALSIHEREHGQPHPVQQRHEESTGTEVRQ
jgi:GH15 family glucan-1,4-alpha-glucosidase